MKCVLSRMLHSLLPWPSFLSIWQHLHSPDFLISKKQQQNILYKSDSYKKIEHAIDSGIYLYVDYLTKNKYEYNSFYLTILIICSINNFAKTDVYFLWGKYPTTCSTITSTYSVFMFWSWQLISSSNWAWRRVT